MEFRSILQKTLLAAALMAPAGSLANEPDDANQEQQSEATVVVEKKSKAQLRHEIEAANSLVYETYNELNLDDDYDIECRKEARLGSQVLRTYCRPRISWEERSPWDEAEDRLSTSRQPSNQAAHNRILKEKMLALAKANPPLMNAIVKRKLLQRELESREE